MPSVFLFLTLVFAHFPGHFSKFRAKVADFGLSAKKSMGACGTPYFIAPEIIRAEISANNAASDVYALGIMLWEMYSRKDPYDEFTDPIKVLLEISDPNINRRPPIPRDCPPEIASLMKDCWNADPEKRPDMQEVDQRVRRLDMESAEPGNLHSSHQLKKNVTAARNEELLFKVFPKHIAEALRDGRKVEPEHHDCVTICRVDIVSFATLSSRLSPAKMSDVLDRLYERFDALSSKHGIFKVETIGDAFLCVSNLATKQEDDHAKRIAEFSIEAIQAANETLIDPSNPAMGHVEIRVGFHSGSATASVVGSRLPKFGIFGETISTASKMESNSKPGQIQCSRRSADLLKQQCRADITWLTPRGKIEIKGKGMMETFFVDRVKYLTDKMEVVQVGVEKAIDEDA